jgi:uracil-DNA glycosylase
MDEIPKSGNLWFWAIQGCLMLNTALTVRHKEQRSHYNMWQWFTDDIIIYINTYFKNIVFVLWGADAYKKINLINQDSNHVIISSHPSGLSAANPMQKYPAFNDFDHFGEINKILKENNIKPILWK